MLAVGLLLLNGSARIEQSPGRAATPPRPAIIQSEPALEKTKKPGEWYSRPGSNGGPLDPQSSALTS